MDCTLKPFEPYRGYINEQRQNWRSWGTGEALARIIYRDYHKIAALRRSEQIHHICGNSLCLNIEHLHRGTQRQNNVGRIFHGTSNQGKTWKVPKAKLHYRKLSPELNAQIRAEYATNMFSQRQLAAKYDVSQVMILKVTKLPSEEVLRP